MAMYRGLRHAAWITAVTGLALLPSVAHAQCQSDAECRFGRICRAGACVDGGCTADSECSDGGTCVAGMCEPAAASGAGAAESDAAAPEPRVQPDDRDPNGDRRVEPEPEPAPDRRRRRRYRDPERRRRDDRYRDDRYQDDRDDRYRDDDRDRDDRRDRYRDDDDRQRIRQRDPVTRIEKRRMKGMIISGAIVLGAAYLLNIAVTAMMVENTAVDTAEFIAVSAIPLVGPWVLVFGDYSQRLWGGGGADLLWAIDGIAQAAGFTLLLVGILVTRDVEVPAYTLYDSPEGPVTVSLLPTGGGAVATLRF